MDHLVNRVHQWKGGTLFSPITGEHQAVVDTLVPLLHGTQRAAIPNHVYRPPSLTWPTRDHSYGPYTYVGPPVTDTLVNPFIKHTRLKCTQDILQMSHGGFQDMLTV